MKKKLGEEATNRMILTKNYDGVDRKYKNFRSVWESVPPENQNIDNLTARLLIEEERQETASTESTMAMVSRKFFYCKKRGHLSIDCYFRKRTENKSHKYAGEKGKSTALVATDKINYSDCKWYLDSGSTHHLCNNRGLLKPINNCTMNIQYSWMPEHL